MPEENTSTASQQDTNTGPDKAGASKTDDRTFTQDDVNRLLANERRSQEQRFAGYDDLKAKAAQFDQLEEANKTELEKAAARAEKAERELNQARHAQLRSEVAAAKQLPADLAQRLSGNTREELEADADKLAALLAPKIPEQSGPTFTLSDANGGASGDTANDARARMFFGL